MSTTNEQTETAWYEQDFISMRAVAIRLYPHMKEKVALDYFRQKVRGQKGWKPEELRKLEDIRKDIVSHLA